ncbi:Mannosyltransferase 1, CMT1 [Phaffia rhodozyma]|uniref:Mannosyltransferase 1, CMT1 n=1 Tax=Phaffia rhodozyma TaxID=264483 RepID=A0A0F7SRQ4_PHARH|nr:Mannosyltransferase 1, CMT1 [Phaffia rhodozyma]
MTSIRSLRDLSLEELTQRLESFASVPPYPFTAPPLNPEFDRRVKQLANIARESPEMLYLTSVRYHTYKDPAGDEWLWAAGGGEVGRKLGSIPIDEKERSERHMNFSRGLPRNETEYLAWRQSATQVVSVSYPTVPIKRRKLPSSNTRSSSPRPADATLAVQHVPTSSLAPLTSLAASALSGQNGTTRSISASLSSSPLPLPLSSMSNVNIGSQEPTPPSSDRAKKIFRNTKKLARMTREEHMRDEPSDIQLGVSSDQCLLTFKQTKRRSLSSANAARFTGKKPARQLRRERVRESTLIGAAEGTKENEENTSVLSVERALEEDAGKSLLEDMEPEEDNSTVLKKRRWENLLDQSAFDLFYPPSFPSDLSSSTPNSKRCAPPPIIPDPIHHTNMVVSLPVTSKPRPIAQPTSPLASESPSLRSNSQRVGSPSTYETRSHQPSPNLSLFSSPFPLRSMALTAAQVRLCQRTVYGLLAFFTIRWLFFSSPEVRVSNQSQIKAHGVIDRIRGDKNLDVHKYGFLQSRLGRDDESDMFDEQISLGVSDYWERYQKPWITGADTAHRDAQVVRNAIDELLKFNGWVAAACPTLSRPFGQNKRDDQYEDLAKGGHLYYIAIVVHSADHFLVDQLAVIVQLAKRLGHKNVFVSMLDSDSTDSTPTLSDLCEAVLTMLGIAFRIRRVPPMTVNPSAAYYPLEEATARNLALDPLFELAEKRQIKFHRVVWLKGFTCPTDVLENLRVSKANDASLVCGMDWAEHNLFFIFSDRWRTRDIEGNLFRQAKSSAKPEDGPPRDRVGTERYAAHLPFQVFCCESGSHVVDPFQSYYKGLKYRASGLAQNLSTSAQPLEMDPDIQCMDSTQMWFCRDLWTDAAKDGVKNSRNVKWVDDTMGATGKYGKRVINNSEKAFVKREMAKQVEARVIKRQQDDGDEDEDVSAAENAPVMPEPIDLEADADADVEIAKVKPVAAAVVGAGAEGGEDEEPGAAPVFHHKQADPAEEYDIHAGSDADAMTDAEDSQAPPPLDTEDIPGGDVQFLRPNSAFTAARILVNPRCVTTYGGVSHTQLARDLFGQEHEYDNFGGADDEDDNEERYRLNEWLGPPDSFVCQEMRTTGGRTAPKSQRRVGFLLQNEVGLAN